MRRGAWPSLAWGRRTTPSRWPTVDELHDVLEAWTVDPEQQIRRQGITYAGLGYRPPERTPAAPHERAYHACCNRATCFICGGNVGVRRNGTLYRHLWDDRWCPASGVSATLRRDTVGY